jgi:ribosome-binding factor A
MTGHKARSWRSTGSDRRIGAGQRPRRVAEQIRHVLAQLLRSGGCRDPALRQASITVTEIRISPDLRNATAYVMPLGGANADDVLAGLRRGAPFLRAQLARELPLRHVPSLVFALDETFDQAARISTLLAQPEVARDLQTQAARGADERGETERGETDDDAG